MFQAKNVVDYVMSTDATAEVASTGILRAEVISFSLKLKQNRIFLQNTMKDNNVESTSLLLISLNDQITHSLPERL